MNMKVHVSPRTFGDFQKRKMCASGIVHFNLKFKSENISSLLKMGIFYMLLTFFQLKKLVFG